MRRQIDGILLLDKSMHFTSNAALQRVKRLFSAKKAGHTGSLDPLATGMLPICFGEATKFSQFLLDADKTYHVTAKLGAETTTGDREGEVVATHPYSDVTHATLSQVLEPFVGEIEQIPPMFSAIKHQGQPLYKLARAGIEVERKPRRVQIYSLEVESLDQDELTFLVHCSKGTYVRTLVQDIGRKLGCGAHISALRRTAVKPYDKKPMHSLATLEALLESAGDAGMLAHLLSVETAVLHYPALKLTSSAAFYLRMGQSVRAQTDLQAGCARLYAESGEFLGVAAVLADGRVKPERLVSGGAR